MSLRDRVLVPATRTLGRLHGFSYLRKWLILSVGIGAVAGAGAIAFVHAIRICEWLFLEVLGGYTPPSAIGEGADPGSGFARPWAIPLVTAVGGLLAGIVVHRFAPEAEGHGTDAAILAVHHDPRGVRGRVAAVKIVASAITIGSGGSAGREGPTAQISSGFASSLARALDLTPADARIAVTVGIGAGIGAIFRAPLGGAVLGAEILYRDDIEAEALFPSFIASITGFAVFGAVEGFTPIFGYLQPGHFTNPLQLLFYAAIGLVAGAVGVIYARSFYGVESFAKRLAMPAWAKPALAGALVGLIGLAVPGALGTGYGWLQRAMGPGIDTIAMWMLLALPFAKIAATSLSIGSGGSGGVFGPGMVIGGFLGAAAWRMLADLPHVPPNPAPFVIVGMVACFGSIAHAPLAMILMVAEMTGNLEMVAPAMIGVGAASLVVGDRSIYANQLRDRRESPAHRFRFGMPLLASVPVSDAMRAPPLVIPIDESSAVARHALLELRLEDAPVTDERGVFRGSVAASDLPEADTALIGALERSTPSVPSDATLEAVVELFASAQVGWVPVLDDDRRLLGVVTASDAVRGYRLALRASLEMLGSAPKGTEFLEATVSETSSVAGARVGRVRWPPGTVIVAIQRGEQMLLPHDDTTLERGDTVSLLVPSGHDRAVDRMVRGEPSAGP